MVREYRLEPTGANIPDLRIEDALNVGWHLLKSGNPDQAYVAFNAVSRHGYFYDADATYLMGAIRHAMGRFDDADFFYNLAVMWYPGYSGGHIERMLDLVRSRERGPNVPEHDWPWACQGSDLAIYRRPFWSGCTPLDGRTILLHDESLGLGDMVQCMRYIKHVRDRGAGEVIVQCDRRIVEFLEICPGIDRVISRGDLPPFFDIHSRIWGLMGIFGLSSEVPYMMTDPLRVDYWRRRLEDYPGFLVGVCWQGGPSNYRDRDRSVPLAYFEPLSRIQGVRLVSLQKGYGDEQLRDCPFPVIDFGDEVDTGPEGYLDTSAIMKTVDLVITVDSSVAHVAGAIGVPTWILLSGAYKEWRWDLCDDDTTPWYPTARLFRQQDLGDWPGVFSRVAESLRKLVG